MKNFRLWTNLTAKRADERQDGVLVNVPVKGTTKIFKGSLVNFTSGLANKGGDTSGDIFAGVCYDTVDNTGADSAVNVTLWRSGVFKFDTTESCTNANIGTKVYVLDDHTVAFVATTTNDVLVGRIVSVDSANVVRVQITPAT